MRKPTATELEISVTRLVAISKGNKIWSATAFFYKHEEKIFLVTNRHCVIKEDTGQYPDKIEIILHMNKNNLSEIKLFGIDLYKEGRRVWLEHSRNGIDIAIIPLELPVGEEYKNAIINTFSKEKFVTDDLRLDVGDELVAIGYPLGFYDDLNNLPIARNATIASPYSVHFKGNPLFLTDGKLQEGMSGSPVITKVSTVMKYTHGTKMGSANYFLVGVNSGYYKINGVDLDLNIIWYVELLEDIIEGKSSI